MAGKDQVKPRFKKGFWKPEEDLILKRYVETHGEGNWTAVSKKSGLLRGAKSCRLRWKNYLRPNIKRGMMSEDEKDLIIRLHKLLGNRWSLIAGRLPGRTDNEIKNYWNTHLNKKSPSRDQITHHALDHDEKHQLSCNSHTLQVPIITKEGEILMDTTHVIDSWVDNLKNLDYPFSADYYSPTLFQNYETFNMPILDNLIFLEPFGISSCSADDELMREATFL